MNHKVNFFFRKGIFPELLSLYRISELWENDFGHFLAILNFFVPFLSTQVKNPKLKKVAPGNFFKFQK